MTREEALQVLIIKANKGAFVEDIINQIFDEHEAQLKAKEEELNKLLNFNSNLLYEFGKRPNEKARSIVAMLFWEWKKANDIGRYQAYILFKKAYAMLKEE